MANPRLEEPLPHNHRRSCDRSAGRRSNLAGRLRRYRYIFSLTLIFALGLGAARYIAADSDIPAAQLDRLYGGAPSQFLTLPGGTRAHYRDRAGPPAGPTMVLLHGANASLHTWEPWAAELSGKLRVITVDLPGHGLTGTTVEGDYSIAGMVEFVDRFTRSLGLEQPFVIGGNSMGGDVAWHFALAHPDRVGKLVLIDASGIAAPGTDGPVTLAFHRAWIVIRRELRHFVPLRTVFEAGLRASFDDETLVTPEMVDRYWKLNLRPGTRRANRFDERPEVEALERLHEIAQPTLILWGRNDNVIPVANAALFKVALPKARLIVYDHCGHFPMEEVSQRSSSDVLAFIQE